MARHKGMNLFSCLYLEGLHPCYAGVRLKSRLQLMADHLLLQQRWCPVSLSSTHRATSALRANPLLQPERRHHGAVGLPSRFPSEGWAGLAFWWKMKQRVAKDFGVLQRAFIPHLVMFPSPSAPRLCTSIPRAST